MNLHKKLVMIFLACTVFFLLCVATITYLIDPFKQYSMNSLKPYFHYNSRYLSPGLVKNYDFDTIIVGSSQAENFLADEVDRMLNTKSLNVSFGGAGAYEHKQIMELAMKTEKVKNVLFSIEFYAFTGEKNLLRHGRNSLPLYLFDDNILNDYKYLLNIDVFYGDNFRALVSNFFGVNKKYLDFKKAHYWSDRYTFSKEQTINDYKKTPKRYREKGSKELNENFNYNLLSLIKASPNTNFVLFFPPYAILEFKRMNRDNWLEDALNFKKYVFNETKELKNVTVFDFQTEDRVTHNLNNYKDIVHYSANINNWMIEQIMKKNYLVTSENIDDNIQKLYDQAINYKLVN